MAKLLAVVGPTAVGKSRLALQLARDFDGEIVNADSRQVYIGLDIGTDKPSPEDMDAVPHHLLNIIHPDDAFSLAEYQSLAYEAIADIQGRGKLPVLTGGSGQYVWAVLEGWRIPRAAPDEAYRSELQARAEINPAELYDELKRVDPEAAGRIDSRNMRRVIRALEVIHQTGKTFSGQIERDEPDFESLIIGLTTDREKLYRAIDERVARMMAYGLVDELRCLRYQGHGPELPAMSSIGYRQIGRYLDGEMDYDEAVRRIKTETHRYVRQQYNWFGLKNQRINWFNTSTDFYSAVKDMVAAFLEGK